MPRARRRARSDGRQLAALEPSPRAFFWVPGRLGDPAAQNNGLGLRRQVAYTSFAISRSLNFWVLPVDVFGSSVNTTWRGHLNAARFLRHQAIRSSVVALWPGLSSTKAQGVSPHFSSSFATTAAAATAGCL